MVCDISDDGIRGGGGGVFQRKLERSEFDDVS